MASSNTGKTLSNTTMNLRFMKNAIRSQETTLPQAKVKDDGEWEVSQAVRDAWGLSTTNGSRSKESNIHEESFLPFLFEGDQSTSSGSSPPTFKGRRVFGRNGEEVIPKPSDDSAAAELASSIEPSESTKTRKIHPRPVTISGNTGGGFLRGFDQLEKSATGPKKTAKQMVFESGKVSSDLRSQLEGLPQKPASAATSATTTNNATAPQFLKPAGVDEPSGSREPKVKRKREGNAIIESARERPKKSKKLKQSPT